MTVEQEPEVEDEELMCLKECMINDVPQQAEECVEGADEISKSETPTGEHSELVEEPEPSSDSDCEASGFYSENEEAPPSIQEQTPADVPVCDDPTDAQLPENSEHSEENTEGSIEISVSCISTPGLNHAPQVAAEDDQQTVEAPKQMSSRRALNQPAWKTEKAWGAILEKPSESMEESEIRELERQIKALSESLVQLDRQIELKLKLRAEMRAQQVHVQPRPRIDPVRVRSPFIQSLASHVHQAHPPVAIAPPGKQRRFIVEFERRNEAPLGLRIGYDDKRESFFIAEVKTSGCVPEWNRTSNQSVEAGDHIVEINNISRRPDAMISELKSPFVRLVVERVSAQGPSQSSNLIPPPPPPPMLIPSQTPSSSSSQSRPMKIDLSLWPKQSADAYEEILIALRNRNSADQPRTGLMKYGDVPIKLLDASGGVYVCDLCRVPCQGEKGYVAHFQSAKHDAQRGQIRTPDLWSRYDADNGEPYWYEHTIGVWSIDDPTTTGTGSHSLVSSR
jgi:hypothetical protein